MSPSRTIAAVLIAGSLVATGIAGFSAATSFAFWFGASDDAPWSAEIGVKAPATSRNVANLSADQAMPWLPIFGTPEPSPATSEGPKADAAPPQFDYALRGIISSGDSRAAILSGSGDDILARAGDVLEDAAIIAIHAESIDIEIGGETRTITFSQDVPIETARIEPAGTTQLPASSKSAPGEISRPAAQEVIFQTMSREELLDVLREAEAKRKQRGLARAAGN